MSTLASLDNTAPTVTPGGEVRCTVRVRNGGEIVESYRFQVVGDPGQFAAVEPPTISLYPAAEGTATVAFRVPRGSRMIATDLPFAVRVLPTERPQFATAAEGVLRVLPFRELSGELLPRTSRGYRTAKHEIAIDNKGNTPVTVALSATDPDQALATRVTPANVTVPPGQAIFAEVRLRHQRLLWRGQPVTRPFRVVAAPVPVAMGPGSPMGPGVQPVTPPMTYDASTVQRPLISSATLKKLIAGLAVLAVLAAAWFLLLRPAVQSAAKDAVAPKNATQPLGGGGGGGGGGGSSPGGSGAGPTSGPSGTETPFNHRLGAQAGAGGQATDQFTVANKTTFLLTDLVLQNPQGDTGRVDVLVNNQIILTMSLANFRDQDYHLVTPVEAGAGQAVSIHTNCTQPGPTLAGTNGTACRTFVLVIGMGIPAT
jgi:hypothetical protein